MANNCGKCKKYVKDTDDGLYCDMCTAWFHAACIGVKKDVYEALQIVKDQFWFCKNCKPALKKNLDRIKTLEIENKANNDKIIALETRNKEIEEKLKMAEEKWDQLKGEVIGETVERVKQKIGNNLIKETTKCVLEQLKEEEERNKRKNNLIFYNVEESERNDPDERISERES